MTIKPKIKPKKKLNEYERWQARMALREKLRLKAKPGTEGFLKRYKALLEHPKTGLKKVLRDEKSEFSPPEKR